MAKQSEKKSNNTGRVVLIIVIIVLILGGGGAAWYFFKYVPEQEAKEKARLEQLAKEEAERLAKEKEAKKRAKYDQLILDADAKFQEESWDTARTIYAEASDLYPKESYPQDQIAAIEAKLAELAAIEAAKPGTIENVNRATGRYYIILSSSIDDDLAMDFAVKLSKKKIDVKILTTKTRDDKYTYFAVSPADFESRAEAEAAVGDYSQYGTGTEIWVLKY